MASCFLFITPRARQMANRQLIFMFEHKCPHAYWYCLARLIFMFDHESPHAYTDIVQPTSVLAVVYYSWIYHRDLHSCCEERKRREKRRRKKKKKKENRRRKKLNGPDRPTWECENSFAKHANLFLINLRMPERENLAQCGILSRGDLYVCSRYPTAGRWWGLWWKEHIPYKDIFPNERIKSLRGIPLYSAVQHPSK